MDGAILSLPDAYPALEQAKSKLSTLSKSEILTGILSFAFVVTKLLTTIIVMYYITTRREQECIHIV